MNTRQQRCRDCGQRQRRDDRSHYCGTCDPDGARFYFDHLTPDPTPWTAEQSAEWTEDRARLETQP